MFDWEDRQSYIVITLNNRYLCCVFNPQCDTLRKKLKLLDKAKGYGYQINSILTVNRVESSRQELLAKYSPKQRYHQPKGI